LQNTIQFLVTNLPGLSYAKDYLLCSNIELAGWLVDHEMIDVLKLKLNPFIQGEGTRLFGPSTKRISLQLIEEEQFDFGLQMLTYNINY
jgi:hypothetical protein